MHFWSPQPFWCQFCSAPKSACEVHLSLFKIQTKGSILYLSLLDGTSFEQIPASVSALSEPSDALQFICTKCFAYVKMSILSRVCACASLWKSYMHYNHAFTMSLYHYPECMGFLYFHYRFINNFVQCCWRIFNYYLFDLQFRLFSFL